MGRAVEVALDVDLADVEEWASASQAALLALVTLLGVLGVVTLLWAVWTRGRREQLLLPPPTAPGLTALDPLLPALGARTRGVLLAQLERVRRDSRKLAQIGDLGQRRWRGSALPAGALDTSLTTLLATVAEAVPEDTRGGVKAVAAFLAWPRGTGVELTVQHRPHESHQGRRQLGVTWEIADLRREVPNRTGTVWQQGPLPGAVPGAPADDPTALAEAVAELLEQACTVLAVELARREAQALARRGRGWLLRRPARDARVRHLVALLYARAGKAAGPPHAVALHERAVEELRTASGYVLSRLGSRWRLGRPWLLPLSALPAALADQAAAVLAQEEDEAGRVRADGGTVALAAAAQEGGPAHAAPETAAAATVRRLREEMVVAAGRGREAYRGLGPLARLSPSAQLVAWRLRVREAEGAVRAGRATDAVALLLDPPAWDLFAQRDARAVFNLACVASLASSAATEAGRPEAAALHSLATQALLVALARDRGPRYGLREALGDRDLASLSAQLDGLRAHVAACQRHDPRLWRRRPAALRSALLRGAGLGAEGLRPLLDDLSGRGTRGRRIPAVRRGARPAA